MNILTVGLHNNVTGILNMLHDVDNQHCVKHLYEKDEAINAIKNKAIKWDWIIIQGHDDPGQWKSILCAVNANAANTPITVLSSHIDGTRLRTPVCSMHNNGNGLSVSRCAMHSLLHEEKEPINVKQDHQPDPIVFEYHAPCR